MSVFLSLVLLLQVALSRTDQEAMEAARDAMRIAGTSAALNQDALLRAAGLMWKRDPERVTTALKDSIEALLYQYKQDEKARTKLRTRINDVINGIAGFAPGLAREEASKFRELRISLGEKADIQALLQLAGASLDADTGQSIALVEECLAAGRPLDALFLVYLVSVERKDVAAAERVARKAIERPAGLGWAQESFVLDAYLNHEPEVVYPIGDKGVLRRSVGERSGALNLTLLQAYAARTKDALNEFITKPTDLVTALQAYQLTRLLELRWGGSWSKTHGLLYGVAINLGASPALLDEWQRRTDELFKRRGATDESASQDVRDIPSKRGTERDIALIKAIYALATTGRFDEALGLVADLDSPARREQVGNYVLFRKGLVSAESKQWDSVESVLGKLSIPEVQAFLLIGAAARCNKADVARPLLVRARQKTGEIGDEALRGATRLVIANLWFTVDDQEAMGQLAGLHDLTLGALQKGLSYPLPDGNGINITLSERPDLAVAMGNAAKVNQQWAYEIARSFNDDLRAYALVSVAAAVLGK